MTVFYLAPVANSPKGGMRTIYQHVDALNAAGIEAAVVHSRSGFRCTWFRNETRVVSPPLGLRASEDVLVIPEAASMSQIACLCPGIKKVIFNQNVYRTFSPTTSRDNRPLSPECQQDVVGMLTVSKDSERYLRHAFPSARVERIRHHIDASVFHPDPTARTAQIAVMPRKRLEDFEQLRAILALRGVLRKWDLFVLKGMTEVEVARTLQHSALFVSMSRSEGFGLPPAEAIACGCHVIGFHGQGGQEFFVEPYAEPIDDGDIIGLAAAVETFVTTYDENRSRWEWVAGEGSRWILSEYSAEHQTADLVACFTGILEQCVPTSARTGELRTRQLARLLPRSSRVEKTVRGVQRTIRRVRQRFLR